MKKLTERILLVIMIALLIFLIIFLYFRYLRYESNIIKSTNAFNTDSMLSIMLENGYEVGEYSVSSNNNWPEGYILNTELSKCENGSSIEYDGANKKIVVKATKSDKCYVYFDVKPTIANKCIGQNMASCIAANYTLDPSIYYHDGTGTYGAYEAGDYSYRYSGANPNNYVCFGSDAETCPEDNKYRIIGVFDGKLKLIKKTSIGSYKWNSDNSNTWSSSTLNTYLNGTYYSGLGTTWQGYIDSTTWIVGGNTNAAIAETTGVKNVYTAEIKSPAESTTYKDEIGLMYVSDYMYAGDPSQARAWEALAGIDLHTVTNYNWLYLGSYEWTITRCSDGYAFALFTMYPVANPNVSSSLGVRPVFYLKSNVKLASGNGTASNPFRLS